MTGYNGHASWNQLNYEHPNWAKSVATMANDNASDAERSDALSSIMSSLESEIEWLVFYENNVDVDGWAQWLEDSDWESDWTIEYMIAAMEEIHE